MIYDNETQTLLKEFKLEAVRLLEQGNKPPADIARELGIKRNQLYKWQDEIHARKTWVREQLILILEKIVL